MSDAQQVRRAVERFQRGRRREHSAFPTSSGGLLHTHYPRTNAGQARTAGVGGDITIGQAPIGEIIVVDGVTDAGQGEPLVWQTVQRRDGFASTVVPSAEIILPHSAIYGLEMWADWQPPFTDSAFQGGGNFWMTLDGSPRFVWPGQATRGIWWHPDAMEFDGRAGQRLSIFLDHGSSSHEQIHHRMILATKEPLRSANSIPPTPVPPPDPGPVQFVGTGSGTPASFSPANIAVDDVVYAVVYTRSTSSTFTTPTAGWDLVADHGVALQSFRHRIFRKTMGAGDLSTSPWDWTGVATSEVSAVRFRPPFTVHDFGANATIDPVPSFPSYSSPVATGGAVVGLVAVRHGVTFVGMSGDSPFLTISQGPRTGICWQEHPQGQSANMSAQVETSGFDHKLLGRVIWG